MKTFQTFLIGAAVYAGFNIIVNAYTNSMSDPNVLANLICGSIGSGLLSVSIRFATLRLVNYYQNISNTKR